MRGLARNVQDYKRHRANCDLPRGNDLDERGTSAKKRSPNLPASFLTVCIDQVKFVEGLVQPDRLLASADEKIKLGELPPKAGSILEALLYRGELPRSEVDVVVGTGERQALRMVSVLVGLGVRLRSFACAASPCFAGGTGRSWMPGLFLDQ